MSDLVVETSSGQVHGCLDRDVPNWRGVPYGRIEARFRPAVAVAPVERVDASVWGPVGWQVPMYAGMPPRFVHPDAVENEQCLNLNIWSPGVDGKARPVLVWLHFGGHVYGSGSTPSMDAWVYAAHHDAVIVTANYRLGPWGWLYLGELDPEYADGANLPVQDQILLLEWIRDNIAQFGGDPGNVTLFGSSSGGSDVGTLLGVPAAQGLFHKAAIYSGTAETPVSRAEAVRRAERFMAGAGKLAGSVRELSEVANVGLRYIHGKQLEKDGRVPYHPFVDGRVLPREPLAAIADGLIREVPLLMSVTAAEAQFYEIISPDTIDRMYAARSGPDPDADRDTKIEFLSDVMYWQPTERLLSAALAAGGRGWWQVFDYVPSNSPNGHRPEFRGRPMHGADVPTLFVDPDDAELTDIDRAVGAEEQRALMGLARDGRTHWREWSPENAAPYRVGP
ncbi:carboxylesterase family protein [Nocardia terpenica]|uniref:Carboxylic ester hydrolase n=1 Tax=Nocardia terpenica TaxID=455432 RepID=A0A291RF23_9NOCA|nr:carboxylesterase family protein [Nocardia terpenica]ATL66176.1 carboxylesterase [Nocardia terpenica]